MDSVRRIRDIVKSGVKLKNKGEFVTMMYENQDKDILFTDDWFVFFQSEWQPVLLFQC